MKSDNRNGKENAINDKYDESETWKKDHEKHCNESFASKESCKEFVTKADLDNFQKNILKLIDAKKKHLEEPSNVRDIIDVTDEDENGGSTTTIHSC